MWYVVCGAVLMSLLVMHVGVGIGYCILGLFNMHIDDKENGGYVYVHTGAPKQTRRLCMCMYKIKHLHLRFLMPSVLLLLQISFNQQQQKLKLVHGV
jgi:hypothetical protein